MNRREAKSLVVSAVRRLLSEQYDSGDRRLSGIAISITISQVPRIMTPRQWVDIYQTLFFELADLLFRYQPVAISSDITEDDLYREANRILDRLEEVASPAELAELMRQVFADAFSPKIAGPVNRYTQVANEFWKLCMTIAGR
jgi:hypothetical protein